MKKATALLLAAALVLALTGCGGTKTDSQTGDPTAASAGGVPGAPEIPGLACLSAMEKKYAVQFDVYYYEGGYKYLAIGDGNNYLLVPEGKTAPAGLDSDVKILYQPLDRIYLAATAAMSLFDAMDSLDVITLTSLNAPDWTVENAAAAMERGEILFGGKYSEPDYELLMDSDVSVAIENTMILHTPKVIDMIEQLGVPVFIEYSSYEPHPLGRTEWIKLYGAMIDREEQAEAVFEKTTALMEQIEAFPNTGKTVAVFLIDNSGSAVVRSPTDYISKMIELGGGRSAFEGVTAPDGSRANLTMTMEEFYATAVNADYLIYNASGFSAEVDTMDKLLEKSSLLADCKAVKEGNVWWMGGETYQQTDKLVDLVADIHRMLTGEEGEMVFLHKYD